MKKILIILLCICTITGCSNKRDKDNIFEAATKKYYESNFKGLIGVDEVQITLEDLLDSDEEYNISSIKKCNPKSKVIYSFENGSIVGTNIHLDCKK